MRQWLSILVTGFVGMCIAAAAKSDTALPDERVSNSQRIEASVVWLLGEQGALQLATTDGIPVLELQLPLPVRTSAIDTISGAFWAAAADKLHAYSPRGSVLASFELPSELTSNGMLLAVDGDAGTAWVINERRIAAYDRSGMLLQQFTAPESVQSVTVSEEGLWLAIGADLWRADLQQFERVLFAPLGEKITLLTSAPDGALWVGSAKHIARLGEEGLVTASYDGNATDAATDGHGGLWVAGKQALRHFDTSLVMDATRVLNGRSGVTGNVVALTSSWKDASAWFVSGNQLYRTGVAENIEPVFQLKAAGIHKLRVLDSWADITPPEINIISPQDNGISNQAHLPAELTHHDAATGVDTASLNMFANGVAISLQCEHEPGFSRCSSLQLLEDGNYSISAEVADYAGNVGGSDSVSIEIDTIRPEITVASHIDGEWLNVPEQQMYGSLNERGDLALNGSPVPLDIHNAFSVMISLEEGVNTLDLNATDLAGNTSAREFTLNLDTIPPAMPIEGQITAEILDDGRIRITGSAGAVEPGATVRITNLRTGETFLATADANGAFSLEANGTAGDVFEVVAVDRAGNQSESLEIAIEGDELPPDPRRIATAIPENSAPAFIDRIDFLFDSSNPVQYEADADSFEEERVSVLRGSVRNKEGSPLAGVEVSVLGKPEYGYTLTPRDGVFDMAVNGGERLVVKYAKEGYLPVQRAIRAGRKGWGWVDDVTMIALDEKVTRIDLLDTAHAFQAAHGSVEVDEDGERQTTLLFPRGLQATITLPDGSTETLSELDFRATEYTVGKDGPSMMPGTLPAASAYTYAVELSVDQALERGIKRDGIDVQFDRPVPFYVDNFLDFPVGEAVPTGYYDNDAGVWRAYKNGRIVEILRKENGAAVLDVSGDGIAATSQELDSLGITDDELRKLAELFESGHSFWRVPLDHLSTWDCNWPYGPPPDAGGPPGPGDGGGSGGNGPGDPAEDSDEENECAGCVIRPQSMSIGESIPVVGAGMNLNYQSSNVAGYTTPKLKVQLSESQPPDSLKKIRLEVEIAGVRINRTYEPAPNLAFEWGWDGYDAYGRKVYGRIEANVRVTYYFPCEYKPGNTGFGVFSVSVLYAIGTRENCEGFAFPLAYPVELESPHRLIPEVAVGWTIDSYHVLDPVSMTVTKGDGTKYKIEASEDLQPIAGLGGVGNSPDGTLAKYARLNNPRGLAQGPDGLVYFSETKAHRVRRITAEGTLETVAGNGFSGFSGDGGLAVNARLSNPGAIDFDPEGNLIIADTTYHRIRRVRTNGVIETIAGSGGWGFSGDGGPATQAAIGHVNGLTHDDEGNLYLVDSGNYRVRRIDRNGIINTIVGDGTSWYKGDGLPASQAGMFAPHGIDFDTDGNILITLVFENRIIKVGPDGIVRTLASGSNWGRPRRPGAPLSEVGVGYPTAIATKNDGGFIFASVSPAYVADVTPDLRARDLANEDDSGECSGILHARDGTIFISDHLNHQILAHRDLPSVKNEEGYLVASKGGSELYQFSAVGRHLRTLHPLTGATIREFVHDADGKLTQIRDQYGKVTEFERTPEGRLTAIIAPGGQRSEVELAADGSLFKVRAPGGNGWQMSYYDGLLLKSFTDPNGNTNHFEYDEDGRLLRDIAPDSGGWALEKVETEAGRGTLMRSGEGRERLFLRTGVEDGATTYLDYAPDGTMNRRVHYKSGDSKITLPNGTVMEKQLSPDPRFGMVAPITGYEIVTTPSGRRKATSRIRTAQWGSDDHAILPEVITEMALVNGKATRSIFSTQTREGHVTTPEGRNASVRMNINGQPEVVHVPGLAPVAYTYNPEGRVESVTVGDESDDRTSLFNYHSEGAWKGWLKDVTDAEGRQTSFEYDLDGRVTQQTLPDGRLVAYDYDANGNLTSITPPGRPAHRFTFTVVDMEDSYAPPDVLPGNDSTNYAYNLDKQLELVTLPDGTTIDYVYGQSTGRLDGILVPDGSYDFSYYPTSGQLQTAIAPDGGRISYLYDGFLPVRTTWSGTIDGVVSYGYNDDFLLQVLNAHGRSFIFGYDDDGLLISAGALSLSRDADSGLLDISNLGVYRSRLQ